MKCLETQEILSNEFLIFVHLFKINSSPTDPSNAFGNKVVAECAADWYCFFEYCCQFNSVIELSMFCSMC